MGWAGKRLCYAPTLSVPHYNVLHRIEQTDFLRWVYLTLGVSFVAPECVALANRDFVKRIAADQCDALEFP